MNKRCNQHHSKPYHNVKDVHNVAHTTMIGRTWVYKKACVPNVGGWQGFTKTLAFLMLHKNKGLQTNFACLLLQDNLGLKKPCVLLGRETKVYTTPCILNVGPRQWGEGGEGTRRKIRCYRTAVFRFGKHNGSIAPNIMNGLLQKAWCCRCIWFKQFLNHETANRHKLCQPILGRNLLRLTCSWLCLIPETTVD